MKADRLLSEILLLQAHGRLSVREIAERLEISTRTAQRDMESLCVAGIPLVALRGSQGGWELDSGWRTEVPGMDETELRAMMMAQPSALADPRLAAAAKRAFDKLMAAMPGKMQAQAATIRAQLHIDASGWRPFGDDLATLPTVQEAVARDQKLTFDYQPPNRPTEARTVEPLGVVCKQNTWYLVARTPSGMRTYRLSRMSNAIVLSTSFERPANFDLASYWQASTTALQGQRQAYEATMALSPDSVMRLRSWCGMTSAMDTMPGLPAGWTVHRVEFQSESHAQFVVLGLGSQARLLAPKDLVTGVRAEFARSQAFYSEEHK